MSLNRYTYANNNPLSYWDPDGRKGLKIDGVLHVGGDAGVFKKRFSDVFQVNTQPQTAASVTVKASYTEKLQTTQAVPVRKRVSVNGGWVDTPSDWDARSGAEKLDFIRGVQPELVSPNRFVGAVSDLTIELTKSTLVSFQGVGDGALDFVTFGNWTSDGPGGMPVFSEERYQTAYNISYVVGIAAPSIVVAGGVLEKVSDAGYCAVSLASGSVGGALMDCGSAALNLRSGTPSSSAVPDTPNASAIADTPTAPRGGAGPATNTAAGVGDEVPAFARSQYGRVPAAERAAALETTPTCPYCGTNPSSQVDHITALRRDWGAGGWADDFATRTARVNDPGNLIGACASCNASKGARVFGEGSGQWWPSG
ncbi:HNH endonuclease [bacterium BMS3Bbin02]|nr:HNH endonuclease [bacterium BMS3Bbin02]